MRPAISQKKGWVITQEAFERMLAELHPDIERAGEQYEKIRRKLVKLFEWRGCPDAEECADETFNRVAQKIGKGASIWTDEPYSFFHGVALYVLREYQRRAEQTAKALEEVAQMQDISVDPEDLLSRETEERERERHLECLNRCLQRLPPESLHLITKYHHGEGSTDKARRKELAQELGITPNALRIRAYRISAAIVECVENCLERESAG
jgi:DNA-directed RNA polymerase specialized sigma24 family protein